MFVSDDRFAPHVGPLYGKDMEVGILSKAVVRR